MGFVFPFNMTLCLLGPSSLHLWQLLSFSCDLAMLSSMGKIQR